MPDNDLGRAHGEIKIESNVDVAKAIAALQALKSRVDALSDKMSRAARSVEKFQRSLNGMGRRLKPLANVTKGLAAGIGSIGLQAGKAAKQISGLDSAMSSAQKTAVGVFQSYGQVRDVMGSVGGVAGALAKKISGVNEELASFPQWTKDILDFSSALIGVKAMGIPALRALTPAVQRAGAAFGGLRSKMVGMAVSGAVMADLAANNSRFAKSIRDSVLRFAEGNEHLKKFSNRLRGVKEGAESVGRGMFGMAKGMDRAITGFTQMIFGVAAVKRGFTTLMSMSKIFVMAFAGLAAVSGTMAMVSKFVLGLANAIGQLAGGVLLLPGVVMAAVFSMGTFAIAMNDMKAAAEAGWTGKGIGELPEHMRGIATAIKELKPRIEDFQKTISQKFWSGFESDARSVINNYLPLLGKGMGAIASQFSAARRNFADFLNEGVTQNNISETMFQTSKIVENLGSALKPAMEGFQALAVAGTASLAELSGGATSLAFRFKSWAIAAQESGKAMGWIQGSIQGFRDLRDILEGSVRGVGKFFKLFSDGGDHGLERAAEAIEKFNGAMDKAATGGGKLGSFVQRIGLMAQTSRKVFDAMTESIADVLNATRDMGQEFYQAFGLKLTQVISIVGQFVEVSSKLLNLVPGFSSLAGSIMATAAATKIIQMATKPFIAMGSVMLGSALTAKGLSNSLLGVATVLDSAARSGSSFVKSGGVVQGGLQKMSNAALGMAGAMSGPVVTAIAAVGMAYTLLSSTSQQNQEKARGISEGYKKASESIREFGDSIREANGSLTTDAIGRLTDGVKEFEETNKKAAENTPGVWTGISDELENIFSFGVFFKDSRNTYMEMKRAAEESRNFENAYKSLGMTSKEVSGYLTGSDAEWLNLVARLKQSGAASGETMKKFEGMRAAAQAQILTARAIGEGNMAVANGIAKLAEEGASATDRLSALKSVMQGLGLIQTTAAEAAADWTLRTKQLAESATQAFSGMDMSKLMKGGAINQDSESGATLIKQLETIREEFYVTAERTGDAGAAFSKLDGTFLSLSRSTGLSVEKLKELAREAGLLPKEVQTFISIKGMGAANTSIVQVMEQLRNIPENKWSTIYLNTKEAMDALKKAGVQVEEWNPETQGARVKIPPDLGKEAIEKIRKQLIEAGIPEATINPAIEEAKKTRETAPPPPPEKPRTEEEKKKQPKEPPPAAEPPPAPKEEKKTSGEQKTETKKETTKVEVEGTDASIGAVNAVRNAIQALKAAVGTTSLSLEVKGTDAAIGAVNAVRNAVQAASTAVGNISMNIELRGTDAAIGAVNAVVDAANNLASRAAEAMARAGSSVDGFSAKVREISTILNSVAASATLSGSSLGENFAKGMLSKEAQVQAAAMRLAQAASRPLPRSPAKIGPFSGRGWTPYRGKSLADGFSKGIYKGIPLAEGTTLDFVAAISKSLDSLNHGAGIGAETSLWANRKPGASGMMFYRDPEKTDEVLRKEKKAKEESERDQRELEAYKLSKKLPDLLKSRDKAIETVATRTKTLQNAKESGDAKRIKNAEESLSQAQKSLRDRNDAVTKSRSSGEAYRGGYSEASSNLSGFVKNLDSAQYGMGEFNQSMIDCSGFVSAVANEATGREAFSERASTTNMREFLLARGFKEGTGGDGDLRVGWRDNGGGANGHTALTLPDGTRAESTTGGVRYGAGSAGADSSQFTNHMYLPGSANRALSDISNNTGEMSDDVKKEMADARKSDKKLDHALNVMSNPKSTDPELIRALQDTSDAGLRNSPIVKQELKSRMDKVMSDRGLKIYDPKEDAYTTDKEKAQGAIKAVQNVLGLYKTVQSGFSNAKEIFEMVARGLENTDDINKLVDGVQGMAETVIGVVNTVVDLIQMAVKLGATAAAAIPGIGPVIAAIANVVDVAGIVQTVIDTVQEVVSVGMMFLGHALSFLMGGADGPLRGKVRTLLDTNDQTIKSWSQENSWDKRTTDLDPYNTVPDKSSSKKNEFNIYANPNAPADEIINEAMYAVRANGQGAYSD